MLTTRSAVPGESAAGQRVPIAALAVALWVLRVSLVVLAVFGLGRCWEWGCLVGGERKGPGLWLILNPNPLGHEGEGRRRGLPSLTGPAAMSGTGFCFGCQSDSVPDSHPSPCVLL